MKKGKSTNNSNVQNKEIRKLEVQISNLSKSLNRVEQNTRSVNNQNKKGKKPPRPRESNTVFAPTSMGTRLSTQQAVVTTGRKTCRVVHSEFITNLISSGVANSWQVLYSYPLNPGMSQTFPWLANMAQNWEYYRFNKLVFRYVTRCGTQTAGSVQMIPDYDAADPQPPSEQFASNLQDVVEDTVWKDVSCRLNPNSLHALGPRRAVRLGAIGTNLDIKTYDAGNFFLALADMAASTPCGKLMVDYDVTFFEPQLPPLGGDNLQIQSGGTVTAANMYGTTPLQQGGLSAVITPDVLQLNNVTPGNWYEIISNVVGTTLTTTSGGVSIVNGASNLGTDYNVVNAAATDTVISQTLKATSNSMLLNLLTGGATTVTNLQTTVTALRNGFLF